MVTNYTGTGINDPQDITTGPDGALWFTNYDNDSIGRITTGGLVSNFTYPNIDRPAGITAGPDGALWFTNSGNRSIGRITTGGVVSNFGVFGAPVGAAITSGPDGALWFTGRNKIGRISAGGVVTIYTDPSISASAGITTGPDGAVWFTNSDNDSIGRINTGVPYISASPVSGGAGIPVTVSGNSFAPGEQVNVSYKTGLSNPRSVSVCSASADSGGTFSCNGNIPPSSTAGAKGAHTIAAKGLTSHDTATTMFRLG